MIVESGQSGALAGRQPRMREAFEALDFARRHRRRDDRDGATRRLRPARRHAVREGRGHLLQLRVPGELLPRAPAAVRAARRRPSRRPRSMRALRGAWAYYRRRPSRPCTPRPGSRPRRVPPDVLRSCSSNPRLAADGSGRCCIGRSAASSGGAAKQRRSSGGSRIRSRAQRCPSSLRRAGFDGEPGSSLAEELFDAISRETVGVVFAVDERDETWPAIKSPEWQDSGRRSPSCSRSSIDSRPQSARHARPQPFRFALGGRAALVHGQHDPPQPRLAQE